MALRGRGVTLGGRGAWLRRERGVAREGEMWHWEGEGIGMEKFGLGG